MGGPLRVLSSKNLVCCLWRGGDKAYSAMFVQLLVLQAVRVDEERGAW